MSVAQAFRYHRPFPFCPTEFSLTGTPASFKNMALADAMKWYWNIETLRFEIAASLTYVTSGIAVSVTAAVDFTLDRDEFLDLAYAPRERVCNPRVLYLPFGSVIGSASGTEEGTPASTDITGLFGWPNTTSDPASRTLFRDPGTNLFWAFVSNSNPAFFCGPDLAGQPSFSFAAPAGSPWMQAGSPINLSIAGAAIDIYLWVVIGTSSISVSSFEATVTPTFFTY